MSNFFRNSHTRIFALGALAATAGVKFLKSDTFHKACVNVVAEGMKIRNAAAAKASKIKEDAEDKCFDCEASDISEETD